VLTHRLTITLCSTLLDLPRASVIVSRTYLVPTPAKVNVIVTPVPRSPHGDGQPSSVHLYEHGPVQQLELVPLKISAWPTTGLAGLYVKRAVGAAGVGVGVADGVGVGVGIGVGVGVGVGVGTGVLRGVGELLGLTVGSTREVGAGVGPDVLRALPEALPLASSADGAGVAVLVPEGARATSPGVPLGGKYVSGVSTLFRALLTPGVKGRHKTNATTKQRSTAITTRNRSR